MLLMKIRSASNDNIYISSHQKWQQVNKILRFNSSQVHIYMNKLNKRMHLSVSAKLCDGTYSEPDEKKWTGKIKRGHPKISFEEAYTINLLILLYNFIEIARAGSGYSFFIGSDHSGL